MPNSSLIKVAVLVDKNIPTDHSFISGVLAGNLLNHDCSITFIGFKNHDQQYVNRDNLRYITRERYFDNFFFVKLEKLIGFTYLIIRSGKYDALFSRNDPIFLVIGFCLKVLGMTKVHFHQISHMHAFSKTERKSKIFRLKSIGDKLIRKGLLKYADRILLVSEAMKKFSIKVWPQYENKYLVFPLGIDEDNFSQETSLNLSERPNDVVYIGTTAKSRKLEVIIKAVKYYVTRFGKLELHIFGKSHHPQDDENLLKLIELNNLQDSIIFHGHKSRKTVIAQLKRSKIGLSTIPAYGLLRQISPTKLMEYMAAGCIVIGTYGIPDQEEIIKDSNGGILIDFIPEKIAKAIHEVICEIDAFQPMADCGRDFILSKRSYKHMAKCLYQELKNAVSQNA